MTTSECPWPLLPESSCLDILDGWFYTSTNEFYISKPKKRPSKDHFRKKICLVAENSRKNRHLAYTITKSWKCTNLNTWSRVVEIGEFLDSRYFVPTPEKSVHSTFKFLPFCPFFGYFWVTMGIFVQWWPKEGKRRCRFMRVFFHNRYSPELFLLTYVKLTGTHKHHLRHVHDYFRAKKAKNHSKILKITPKVQQILLHISHIMPKRVRVRYTITAAHDIFFVNSAKSACFVHISSFI